MSVCLPVRASPLSSRFSLRRRRAEVGGDGASGGKARAGASEEAKGWGRRWESRWTRTRCEGQNKALWRICLASNEASWFAVGYRPPDNMIGALRPGTG